MHAYMLEDPQMPTRRHACISPALRSRGVLTIIASDRVIGDDSGRVTAYMAFRQHDALPPSPHRQMACVIELELPESRDISLPKPLCHPPLLACTSWQPPPARIFAACTMLTWCLLRWGVQKARRHCVSAPPNDAVFVHRLPGPAPVSPRLAPPGAVVVDVEALY